MTVVNITQVPKYTRGVDDDDDDGQGPCSQVQVFKHVGALIPQFDVEAELEWREQLQSV